MAGPQPGQSHQTVPPRFSILRCIIVTIITLIITVCLIILIIWLVIRPAPVNYSVEKAQIRDYNLSSSNALSATFDLSIQTYNRNKRVSIFYDSIEVSVWYSDQMLAFSNLEPFHQPKHNVTTLHATPTATSVPLRELVVKTLKRERSAGEVNLEVKVEARVRFKFGAAKSRHYTMEVDCSPVLVHFASFRFQRVECDVDI